MIAGDQDRGKGLVVAQKNVVARTEPLDEVRFQQQGLGLGVRGDELEPARFRDHPPDTQALPFGPGVGRDALLQVLGLADVKNLALAVQHPVDAGLGRQAWKLGADGRRAGPAPGRRRRVLRIVSHGRPRRGLGRDG